MDDLEDDFGNTIVPISKYKWFEERISLIKQLYKSKEKTHFTLIGLRLNGFIAKTNGLNAYIVFNKMPWAYSDNKSWEIVSPYLYGELFDCEIDKLSINPFSFTLDGTVKQFKKAELKENIEYEGVIIKKGNTYLVIDIGYHFNWECGSIIGVLNKSNFLFSNLNPEFDPGHTIKIKYDCTFENRHICLKKDFNKNFWQSLHIKSLLGLIVDVRYYKNEDFYDEFWVKDRYKGLLAFSYDVYGEALNEVIELKNNLEINEIIQCEILAVNPIIGYFTLKWMAPTKSYKFWHSEEIDLLEGKIVYAKLIEIEDQFVFIINDLYDAILPLSINIYPDNFKAITKLYYDLNINDVIKCEILKANREKGFFIIKWILENEKYIDWDLIDIDELIKTTTKAKIVKNRGKSNIEYLIDDKYKAMLYVNNNSNYNKDSNAVFKYLQQMNDGEYIDCQIMFIDRKNEFLQIKWLNYEGLIFWATDVIQQLYDNITWVRVVKKEGCEIEFFVNDIHKAMLPLTNDIYKNNFDKIKYEYTKLHDFEIINCKVRSIDIRNGIIVLKWMLTPKPNDFWLLEEVDNMIGGVYEAKAIKEKNYKLFIINNKYKALLTISKELYQDDYEKVLNCYKTIEEGEIIYCEIIGVEKDLGFFNIKWININKFHPKLKPFVLKAPRKFYSVKYIRYK